MILGVTGTREELTVDQFKAMTVWMRANPFTELHHGCCIGADDEAWQAARSIYYRECTTVAHVPEEARLASGNAIALSDESRPPLPYLDRNRAIVDACDVLLALPKGPDGTVETEELEVTQR